MTGRSAIMLGGDDIRLRAPTCQPPSPSSRSPTPRVGPGRMLLRDESIRLHIRVEGLYAILLALHLVRTYHMRADQIIQQPEGPMRSPSPPLPSNYPRPSTGSSLSRSPVTGRHLVQPRRPLTLPGRRAWKAPAHRSHRLLTHHARDPPLADPSGRHVLTGRRQLRADLRGASRPRDQDRRQDAGWAALEVV